jgi:hypothetical protein
VVEPKNYGTYTYELFVAYNTRLHANWISFLFCLWLQPSIDAAHLMLLTEFLIYNELAEKSTRGADSMVMAFHNVELHHLIWRSPPKT